MCELERVLREYDGFFSYISATYDDAVLLLLSYHARLKMTLRCARAVRVRQMS